MCNRLTVSHEDFYLVSSILSKPTTFMFVSVRVIMHTYIVALFNGKLLDAVFTKHTENEIIGISCAIPYMELKHVFLRHP